MKQTKYYCSFCGNDEYTDSETIRRYIKCSQIGSLYEYLMGKYSLVYICDPCMDLIADRINNILPEKKN